MNTFNLRLDLDKAPTLPLWVTIRQGDKNGTTISASIYDHGTLLAGSYNARIAFRLPDDEHYYRKDATFSSGVATVTIDETEAASVTGNTVGYFEILSGSTVIASTASFGIHVLQSATEGMTPGENYDTAIQDAIDGLNEAVAELPDTVEGILEEHPEWTTTVQDGSITDAKLIQSGGILDRVARLWHRLDNLLTSTPAEADALTVSDAAKTPLAGLALYGRSTQDGTPTPSSPVAIQSVEPNILQNTASTTTTNGITFTVNADGSVTANGTATANAQLLIDRFVPADGTYTVSGCPTGGSSSTYAVRVYANNGGTYKAQDVGNGATFSFTASTDVNLSIYIFVFNNTTVSNLTFGPMVARGTTAIAKFVPYGCVGLWAKRTSDATQQSVTPIDLQGHELRSLPDGTRDEVTVDQYGHAVLVQRVGHVEASAFTGKTCAPTTLTNYVRISCTNVMDEEYASPNNNTVGYCNIEPFVAGQHYSSDTLHAYTHGRYVYLFAPVADKSSWTNATAYEWVTAHSPELLYPLATPVTIDLGTIDPVALQGPDMTAQAVPTAPFALTYERDLNIIIGGIYAQLAPVDGPTATSNHGVGTYLMLGGTLCKVTTAIAVGEQITIGTNVVATTVMAEILALTA